MKCIKEKCQYYTEHDFYASSRICILDNRTFDVNNEKDCPIENVIQSIQHDLEYLEEYKTYISSSQTK